MAISSQEVSVAVCSCCGHREYSEDGTFAGVRGIVIDPANGSHIEWYSCLPGVTHLGKSVSYALIAAAEQTPADD